VIPEETMKKLVIVLAALAVLVGSAAPTLWAQAPVKSETKAAPPVKTAASAPAPAAAPKKEADKKAEKKDSEKLDLNTASTADLKGAGFSDAEAKKIVDGRPYKRKDDLVKKNIVTKEKYEQVKEGIIAHQVKTEAKKK
jgi:competence protein ComEA